MAAVVEVAAEAVVVAALPAVTRHCRRVPNPHHRLTLPAKKEEEKEEEEEVRRILIQRRFGLTLIGLT